MMDNAKHAPGPWHNDYMPSTGFGAGYGKSQIIDAGGNAIAAVAIVNPTYGPDGGFDQATFDRLEATAALIASAPTLAAIVQNVIELHDADTYCLTTDELEEARAVLKRITAE